MVSSGPTVPMIMASIKAVVPLMETNNDQLHITWLLSLALLLIPVQVHVKSSKAYITPKS